MQETVLTQTRTDRVYERMRADIFAARLRPGQRLKFPELCSAYDTSVGVAREALARLGVERLVRPQAHRGYTVVELSADALADLTSARVELESLVFHHAVEHGGVGWEAEILSSHHLLCRIDVPLDSASDDELESWYRAHEFFHRSLLSGCPSRRLREIALGMRSEAELYRRWALPLGNEKNRDVASEHAAILDAALAHDADEASGLLGDHIIQTSQILISGVSSVPAASELKPESLAKAAKPRRRR